jgi:hypothetical protein
MQGLASEFESDDCCSVRRLQEITNLAGDTFLTLVCQHGHISLLQFLLDTELVFVTAQDVERCRKGIKGSQKRLNWSTSERETEQRRCADSQECYRMLEQNLERTTDRQLKQLLQELGENENPPTKTNGGSTRRQQKKKGAKRVSNLLVQQVSNAKETNHDIHQDTDSAGPSNTNDVTAAHDENEDNIEQSSLDEGPSTSSVHEPARDEGHEEGVASTSRDQEVTKREFPHQSHLLVNCRAEQITEAERCSDTNGSERHEESLCMQSGFVAASDRSKASFGREQEPPSLESDGCSSASSWSTQLCVASQRCIGSSSSESNGIFHVSPLDACGFGRDAAPPVWTHSGDSSTIRLPVTPAEADIPPIDRFAHTLDSLEALNLNICDLAKAADAMSRDCSMSQLDGIEFFLRHQLLVVQDAREKRQKGISQFREET